MRAEFRLQRRQRHAGEVGGPTLPHARTKIYPQRVDGGALARWTPNSRGELATTVDKRGGGRAGRSQSSGCDVDGDGLGSPEAGGCSGDLAMVPGEVRRRGREGKAASGALAAWTPSGRDAALCAAGRDAVRAQSCACPCSRRHARRTPRLPSRTPHAATRRVARATRAQGGGSAAPPAGTPRREGKAASGAGGGVARGWVMGS